MRAFVKLRQTLAAHKDLARKLAALEAKYDTQFKAVFEAMRQLMTPPEPTVGSQIKQVRPLFLEQCKSRCYNLYKAKEV